MEAMAMGNKHRVIALIIDGALAGAVHGIALMLTTDPATKTLAFMATGNIYAVMYFVMPILDALTILLICLAPLWMTKIENWIDTKNNVRQ